MKPTTTIILIIKSYSNFISIFSLIVLMISSHLSAQNVHGYTSLYLDSCIQAKMEFYNVPGLSASIVKDGQIRWIGTYGYANIEQNIPVDTSTLFMLASISKTFTATALMQLWEQGHFELDDAINDYTPFNILNPNYPPYAEPITFRTLCTHTSSIKDNWEVIPYYWGEDSPIPIAEFIYEYLDPEGIFYDSELNFYSSLPGNVHHYSSVGTALIAYLIELLDDSTFAFQTYDRIFEPLQMNETAWFLSDLDTNHIAMPYQWNGTGYTPYGHYGYYTYPSGTLRTSIDQLSYYLLCYMNGGSYLGQQILQDSTVELMLTPQLPPQINPYIGIIWWNFTSGGRDVWGHAGGDPGVRTRMWFCPEENSGVIILSNGESDNALNTIQDILFDFAKDSIVYCLPEGITFSTQEEIDNFQSNYPGCSEILGDVTIYGDDITNLHGLNVITSIDGSLTIGDAYSWYGNPQLINLYGLDNLLTIGGDLWIVGNDTLSSLEGFESLVHIGGGLTIGGHIQIGPFYNPCLTNLSGLSGLSFIGDGITIKENKSLTNLNGLEGLYSIDGGISILGNPALISLSGIEGLTSMGDLFITGNDALSNLSGLEGLTTINGSLEIWGNNSLTSLSGLEGLTSIDGNLSIGDWWIGAFAPPLTNLDGLETLSSISGNLEISLNNTLTNLAGMNKVSSIGGDLMLLENNALTSLAGLEYIEAASIENLYIAYNPLLSQCEIKSICDYLAAPNGIIDIQENAPGCDSPETVLDSCEDNSVVDDEQFIKDKLVLYPNPSSRELNISATGITINEVLIYTYTGQMVIAIRPENSTIDISTLQPGMYIVELTVDGSKFRQKLLVQK